MSKWHGGKGSKQRPTDHEKYNDNWDRIFNKNKGERANWYGEAEKLEEEDEGDVSGDTLPQNSFRPG